MLVVLTMEIKEFSMIIERYRYAQCIRRNHIPLGVKACAVCQTEYLGDIISLTIKCLNCNGSIAILKEGFFCVDCVHFI